MTQTTQQINADGQQVTQPVNQQVTVTTPSAEQQSKPQRPEWCPEKFWNAERGEVNSETLAKSYAHLETKQGQQQAKPADQQQNTQQTDQQQQEQPVPAQAQVIQKVRDNYAKSGQLTDVDYADLAAAGYDRATVDVYMAGVKAQETAIYGEAFALTGGEEGYTALMQWAATNLSKEEQDDFDARVTNTATMKKAVSELVAKQKAALGSDGKKTTATAPNAPVGVTPYKTKQELMAAVNSAEYKTSAEFRHQHGLRILAAEKAGINLWV